MTKQQKPAPKRLRMAKPEKGSTKGQQKALTYEEKKDEKLRKSNDALERRKGKPGDESRFYCTNKELLAELVRWRDSAENPDDRTISEELGKMMIVIGTKVLNRSEFRNYSKELKEDMRGFGFYKVIRGLKNYDFRFQNAFSFFTTAFFNAYLTVLKKYYKHINIKKDLMEKLLGEMESFPGMNASSSLNKAIKQYLGEDQQD